MWNVMFSCQRRRLLNDDEVLFVKSLKVEAFFIFFCAEELQLYLNFKFTYLTP
jgi:hypothetical protein